MDMVTYAALSKQIRESGGAAQGADAVFVFGLLVDDDGFATQLTCTLSELKQASESGKILMCTAPEWAGICLLHMGYTDNAKLTVLASANVTVECTVAADGSVRQMTYSHYLTPTDIATAIDENATNVQVPSAKAVHDYVQQNISTGGGNAPIYIDIDTEGHLAEKYEDELNYSELFNIVKENHTRVFVRVYDDVYDESCLPKCILPFVGFTINENDASEESPALKFGLIYRKAEVDTLWYFNAYISPQSERNGIWYSHVLGTHYGYVNW